MRPIVLLVVFSFLGIAFSCSVYAAGDFLPEKPCQETLLFQAKDLFRVLNEAARRDEVAAIEFFQKKAIKAGRQIGALELHELLAQRALRFVSSLMRSDFRSSVLQYRHEFNSGVGQEAADEAFLALIASWAERLE